MENIYSTEFYWWVGVVEDRQDPMYLGRCRVRIVGHHTPNKSELPTEDLPWAYPLQPITSAAMSGVGHTPMGPVEGTWVTGYFRDGEDCQEPIMMGTMGGIPGKSYYDKLQGTNKGFQDPDKKYPRAEYLENSEPDTNRLARNQSIGKTIVKIKDDARVKDVPIAIEGKWNQPLTAYNASYPYNHVFESESGHTIEIDDTEGNERLTMYHKAGTYVDVDKNGTMVRRVVGDNYEIFVRHNNVLIKGDANITVEGNCNIYVKNNVNLEVDGDMKTNVHGNYELNVAGKIDIASGKETTVDVGKDLSVNSSSGIDMKSSAVNIESSGEMKVKAGATLKMGGASKTSLTSPITEGNMFKGIFKGVLSMSIPPVPVPPVSGASVRNLSPVESRSPSLPSFPTLLVPNREEVLTFTLDLLGENFEENATVIRKLQEEAIAEGIITQEELSSPQPVATAEDSAPPPSRPLTIPGCGDINNQEVISDSLKISDYFTIGNFTNAVASRSRLRAFNGNTIQDMACNLKALAEQCIDPIKSQYPNMIISSGFRDFIPEGGALNSQHLYGQAADLQFPGFSKDKYYEVAQWIKNNLNFDQMLLEYKTTGTKLPWIHISFNRNGTRSTFGTFMNHRYATRGRNTLLNLANV